ncbi:chaplin, partial [Streptomyces sp. NPDC005918]
MLSAAAATSILSLSGTHAFAASEANGQALDSPGFLSGNSVSAPVDVPVNACGNSVDAAAGLNPAFGNSCASYYARSAYSPPAMPSPAPPAPAPQAHAPQSHPAPAAHHHEHRP